MYKNCKRGQDRDGDAHNCFQDHIWTLASRKRKRDEQLTEHYMISLLTMYSPLLIQFLPAATEDIVSPKDLDFEPDRGLFQYLRSKQDDLPIIQKANKLAFI